MPRKKRSQRLKQTKRRRQTETPLKRRPGPIPDRRIFQESGSFTRGPLFFLSRKRESPAPFEETLDIFYFSECVQYAPATLPEHMMRSCQSAAQKVNALCHRSSALTRRAARAVEFQPFLRGRRCGVGRPLAAAMNFFAPFLLVDKRTNKRSGNHLIKIARQGTRPWECHLVVMSC